MSGSYTSVEKRVLFALGDGSSISTIGSFPLLLPLFTAELLKGDICTNEHRTDKKNGQNTKPKHKNLIRFKVVQNKIETN